MAAIQNTMRLAALLAFQTLGGPPVRIARKILPIRKGLDAGTKFIAQARRYCDEQGRCVEQLAPFKGALAPNMCRFFGYGDVVLDADDTAQRDVEVQFPIAAKSVEDAYAKFDDAFAQFISSLQAATREQQEKAPAPKFRELYT